MNLKSLHKIIRSLSEEDYRLVRKSLSCLKGKKSKYQILFDSLRKEYECSESFEERLRNKYFPRYDQVYRTKEFVLDKIVTTLAEVHESAKFQLGFIKTAFQLEAFELGEKTLISEMKSAQSDGNSIYLLELHLYIAYLKDYYNLKVSLPNSILGYGEILKGQSSSYEIDKILSEIRIAIKGPSIDRKRISKSISSKIEEFQDSWLPFPVKLKRLKVRNLILGMEYDMAMELQNDFVGELMKTNEDFPLLLKETELLMRLSLNLGKVQLAQYAFLTLSQLSPKSLLDWRLKKRSEIRNGIFYSSFSLDKSRTLVSWKMLLEFQNIFSVPKLINLIYSVSYIFFTQESYREASEALDKLEEFKRPNLAHLNWQIGLLRTMLFYEMQRTDLLDSVIRGTERLVKIAELKLPGLAVSAVKAFHNKGKVDDILLDKYISRYHQLNDSEDEKRAMYYFNLEAWLLSKKKKTSMASIEVEMRDHERQKMMDQLA